MAKSFKIIPQGKGAVGTHINCEVFWNSMAYNSTMFNKASDLPKFAPQSIRYLGTVKDSNINPCV